MAFSPELIALGRYLAGEFNNRQQALAEPIWYVHLHLWLRPVPLFTTDSLTLFAEQASITNLDKPYRPRILRLRQTQTTPVLLQVEHYLFKDMIAVQGAGRDRKLLQQLTPEQIEFLPGCTLDLKVEPLSPNSYHFRAFPNSGQRCCFTYGDSTYQVSLGLEVTPNALKTYDKGIDPNTGKAIWGALMGPYCYTKHQDFSAELPV